MFKKIFVGILFTILAGALLAGAINRTQAKTDSDGTGQGGGGYGRNSTRESADVQTYSINYGQEQGTGGRGRRSPGNANNETNQFANLPPAATGELNTEENAALLYMREEEKLAHDVYVTLYEQWELPVFQNIAASEQTHTQAVLTLIERYGLVDPASTETGVFTDPALQALYNELTTRGSQSLAEAIRVGAEIEEIDILDLQERLAQTRRADIQQVFNNLLRGSYNHLNAFAATLQTQTGETYQPQHLSTGAYQAIVSARGSRGDQSGQGGSGNGSQGRGMNGQGGGGGRPTNSQP